ncbi:unnamed protein product, partial [marine sediment metagenome]
ETELVVSGEVAGAPHQLHPLGFEEISSGVKKLGPDLVILNRFEEAEKTDAVIVKSVVVVIHNRGYAADQLPVSARQKILD